MECNEFLAQVEELALGDAEAERIAELSAHAAACPACAARLAETRALNEQLRALRRSYVPPEGLADRIRAALDAGSAAPEAAAGPRGAVRRLRRWASVAAAALLVALTVGLSLTGFGPAVPPAIAAPLAAYDDLSNGLQALAIRTGDARAIQDYLRDTPGGIAVPEPRCCDQCVCPPGGCSCILKGACTLAMPSTHARTPCILYEHAGTPLAMLVVDPPDAGTLAKARRVEHQGHTLYRFDRGDLHALLCPTCDPSRLWVSRLPADTLLASSHAMMRGLAAPSGASPR
jgi:hypothetical protein